MFVVSQEWPLGLLYLINGMHPHGLDNGRSDDSEYEDGQWRQKLLVTVAIESQREDGRALYSVKIESACHKLEIW